MIDDRLANWIRCSNFQFINIRLCCVRFMEEVAEENWLIQTQSKLAQVISSDRLSRGTGSYLICTDIFFVVVFLILCRGIASK
jgi:hypothetical protein